MIFGRMVIFGGRQRGGFPKGWIRAEYCFESTFSGKRTHWASLSFGANSVSSTKNSVSSLWHTNNRPTGTHSKNSLSSVFETVLPETVVGLFSKRVVLADVPPERQPERGYIRIFPWNENRNQGTFACSPGTKTGTRVRSHVPPEWKPEREHIHQNHAFTKLPSYLLVKF